jgi:hypothetical protein
MDAGIFMMVGLEGIKLEMPAQQVHMFKGDHIRGNKK